MGSEHISSHPAVSDLPEALDFHGGHPARAAVMKTCLETHLTPCAPPLCLHRITIPVQTFSNLQIRGQDTVCLLWRRGCVGW